MNLMISLLAIFGLYLIIKETDGPWGIIAWARNFLMRNKYVGVFFYQLLDCPICLGFHAGYIIYLLKASESSYNASDFVLWGLAGSALCFLLNSIVEKLLIRNS